MRKRMQVGAILLSTVAFGCAGPRYIAASTASKGQVKFLHIDGGGGQGIVKCRMSDDGDLSDCRDIQITLTEDQ